MGTEPLLLALQVRGKSRMNRVTKQSGVAKKWVLGCLGAVVLVVLLGGIWLYPAVRDVLSLVPKDRAKQGWTPATEKNLNVLYTAMKLAHDSDGTFPKSDKWMDKVITRVRTEDLKTGAEKEKFVDPAAGGKPGEYGFAMNDLASEKYIEDLKDKKMPLIFQSMDASWNAHGDPAKIGRKGGIGISVEGKIVKLQ
jgi:hypothetical protein